MKAARTDIIGIFSQGGKDLLNLLDYCIRSIQTDPVFIFLVQDYRNAPTVAKAVALYDLFCVPNALARLTTQEVIPPLDLRLQIALRPFREYWTRAQAVKLSPMAAALPPLIPPKYLFDVVAGRVQESSKTFSNIGKKYKGRRTPTENLPGGKMTAPQRYFVEKIWQPIIRPQLVAAGFWRIASIG